MCGPTGVGVIYGKEKLLNKMKPIIFGGGMNSSFESDHSRVYNEIPHKFEAGTPNIAGVIAFGEIVKYLNKIGINNIHKHEVELKKYALEKLKSVKDIIIYNETSESGIIAINIKDIFARAGNHCAKILKDDLKIKNTCRISFYFYNTFEEIDKLVEALKNPNIKNEII